MLRAAAIACVMFLPGGCLKNVSHTKCVMCAGQCGVCVCVVQAKASEGECLRVLRDEPSRLLPLPALWIQLTGFLELVDLARVIRVSRGHVSLALSERTFRGLVRLPLLRRTCHFVLDAGLWRARVARMTRLRELAIAYDHSFSVRWCLHSSHPAS